MPSSSSFPLLSPDRRRTLRLVQYLAQGPGAELYPLDENTQPQPRHVPSPFRASSIYHPNNHRVTVATTVAATCNLNDIHPQPNTPYFFEDSSHIPLPDESEYVSTNEDDLRYLRQRGHHPEPVVENHETPVETNEAPAETNEAPADIDETSDESDSDDNETLDEEYEFHRKHLALHSGGKTLNSQQPPAHYLRYPAEVTKTPSLDASSSISGDDSDYEAPEEDDSDSDRAASPKSDIEPENESDDDSLTPLPSTFDSSPVSNRANAQPEPAQGASSRPIVNSRPVPIARPVANARALDETQPQEDLSEEEHEYYQIEDPVVEDEQSDDESKDSSYRTPERSRKRRAPPKTTKVTKTKKRVAKASSSRAKSSRVPSDSESALVTDSTSESEQEPNDPDMITPPTKNAPLPSVNGTDAKSPARAANTSSAVESQSRPDTGTRNSKARATNASSPIGPQSGEARREGEKLATDLDQLQVRSPPLQPEQSTSSTQSATNGVHAQSPPSMPLDIPRRQESTNSSSTEGSQGHPYPPSSLSDYTPEGYLKSMMPNAEQQQVDPVITAAAHSAADAADAAIMRLNGTSSVHTSSSAQQGYSDQFALPGGFAGFANPNSRNNTGIPRPGPMHPSRQTSTSTASASTSSEEEDICVPVMERANPWETEPQPPVSRLPFDPYVPSALQQHRSPASNPRSSNGPRGSLPGSGVGYTAEPAALPLGATAHSPRGTTNSVPAGIANNESSEDDDDDGQTVGDRSSRSRSTSSEIQQAPTVSKGKRKAAPAPSATVSGKTTGKAPVAPKAGESRPQKRRRSEVSDSQIDPSLKAEVDDVKMESEDGTPDDSDEDDYNSDESEYDGPSRPRAKPRRVIAGRNKAAAPKATTKKTKPTKTAPKPSSDGTTQCDYVQPYPPYTRCTHTFTRKYDLPRHKDRHAAEEREAVAQGKVSEDKATLWASIKNRPAIECPKCHQTFTRQDAFKRHCKNQNH